MKKIIAIICVLILIVSLSCFAFAGCNKQKKGVVRLNEVTHSVFYAPLYAAINLGYFEEEGITVELTNGGGADKTMTAVLSGQADIGFCGPEAAVYVYNEGRKDYPKVFAQLTQMDGSFVIGREHEDFDWSTSFKGKEIIGGRRGGMPAMSLEYALKRYGYSIGTDVIINYDIQFDLITAAFEGGTGDYCTMFEPSASTFEKAGKGYILSAVGPASGNIPYTAFMATADYLKDNEDTVKGFCKALKKGVDYVQTQTPEKIAEAIAPSFEGTSKEMLARAVKNYRDIGAYVSELSLKKEDFDRMQDVIISAGVYKDKVPYEKIVVSNFLE
ncbi:MAG: ABC transporter substrate-binding protein [Clostridia bacterium]|nr:ABC transporter substrate-binding protein [Clostridia bacterium]